MITAFAVNAAQGNGEMKMTKFEEEVKRPVIGIGQSSIKPALGKAVEFYTDKVKEYHNAFSDMNKYIDVIENALEKKDEEIADLKSQLQQQALPVVPKCVAEWYESYGKSSESLEFYIYLFCGEFYSSRDSRKNRELTNFEKWFGEDKNKPIETLIRMQDGYTVEKPQLFYLKNKLTDDFLYTNSGKFSECEKNSMSWKLFKTSFTQAEIDSMEAGSYEQIEVAE